MSRWYFVDEGKACGPLGEEDVLAAVEQGRLGPLDLIFQEGSEKWLPARDVEEFREVFRAKDEDKDAQPTWVLLRKKAKAQGAGYIQSGPYSAYEIREKIEAGEVDYTDFIWKEGMKSWRKLVEAKEFKKIFKKIPVEMLEEQTITNISIQPEIPGEELLKDVMQGQNKKSAMDFSGLSEEAPPTEAAGPDLTQGEPPPVEESEEGPPTLVSPEQEEFLKERKKKGSKAEEAKKSKIPEAPVVAKRETIGDGIKEALPKAMPSLPVGLFMTLAAFIFLATGAWLVYSSLPSKEEKEAAFRQAEVNRQQLKKREEERARQEALAQERAAQEAAAAAQQAAQQEAQQPESPPPEPPKPKEWPRVEPSYVRIAAKDLTTASATVEFETDGSHHFPVEIKMMGEAGQILNRRSYWRQWTLKTGPDKPRVLNLAALRLGEGSYRLEATIGKKATRTEFFVGKRGAGFNSDLDQHRKKISLFHQRERRRLFKTATQLKEVSREFETQAYRLAKNRNGWNSFFRAWSKKMRQSFVSEMKVSPSNVGAFVYPQAWMDLKGLYVELDQATRKVHAKMNGKTSPDVSEIRKIQGQLTREAQQAAAQSLWR